jgi:adenylate kinase family enzyme
MSNAYIFYGKAGSGKGTQAQLLKTHLESQGRSVVYIETGGLFRNFVETNTGFSAQRTKTVIESGQLMPAFFPIYLWSQAMIEHFDGTQDLILDGLTRRIEEAPILESALDFFQIEKKIVFNIHIDDAIAQTRLAMRAGDRPDDADPVKIQKRLDWYNEKVLPVLEYFKQNNTMTMCDIDGEPDVAQVQNQVLEFLDKI